MNQDCIFCRILAGQIAPQKVAENDVALAFLDVQPVAKGHTLVVSKTHAETILDLEPAQLHGLFDLVAAATKKIEDNLKTEGFNIGINMREASNGGLEHLHVHIIPRWLNDGGGSMHTIVQQPPKESIEDVLKQINS